MILQMIGLSTLVLLVKNTTITAGQKFHSGKNQKNGLKGKRPQDIRCTMLNWMRNISFNYVLFVSREQRQKEASKMSVNSFPKDRDYRREVMQATAASGFASGSMCY